MAGTAFPEAFAGHGDDALLIEEAHRECIARQPGLAHVDHHEHAALRHVRQGMPRTVEPVEECPGAAFISLLHRVDFRKMMSSAKAVASSRKGWEPNSI